MKREGKPAEIGTVPKRAPSKVHSTTSPSSSTNFVHIGRKAMRKVLKMLLGIFIANVALTGVAFADQVTGSNLSDYSIPDLGSTYSSISISGAPAGSTITSVEYNVRVVHTWVGDLRLRVRSPQGTYYTVWNRLGGTTDGGNDDDAADDNDIWLSWRTINSAFDGQNPNGTWRLYAYDDAGGDTGNIDYFEIRVNYQPPMPDPTITNVSYPSSVLPGQSITIRVDVRNDGAYFVGHGMAAISVFNYSDVNSRTSNFDNDYKYPAGSTIYRRSGSSMTSSYVLVEADEVTWSAGESGYIQTNITAPSTTGTIVFYVRSTFSDSSWNIVSEEPTYSAGGYHDQQGFSVNRYTIDVVMPDLIAFGISTSTTTVAPGGSLTVDWTARNQGGASCGASYQGIMLSTNTIISSGDTELGTEYLGSMSAGASSPESQVVTIPAGTPDGTYYIGILADYYGAISESSETNNDDATPVQITVQTPPPDPTITNVTYPSQVTAGGSVTIRVDIRNDGAAFTGHGMAAISVFNYSDVNSRTSNFDNDYKYPAGSTIYRRSGSSMTSSYVLVEADEVTWSAGESGYLQTTITAPPSTGTIVFYVRSTFSDSSWNLVAEEPTYSAGGYHDQQGFSVNRYTIDVVMPDLIASGISTSITTVAPGGSLTVDWTARNQGGASCGTSYQGIMLSTNTIISASDTELGTEYLGSMSAGASSPESQVVTIPAGTPDGTYYIGILADYYGAIVESSETNNDDATPVQITVHTPKPDLIVEDIWTTGDLHVGKEVTISASIRNQGDAGTGIVSIPIEFYVDGNYEGTEYLSFGLGAGSINTESIQFTAQSDGTKPVTVVIDPGGVVLDESDNTNNSLTENYTWIIPSSILSVPYYYQDGADWCWAAAASMILKYYGYERKIWEIAADFNKAKDEGEMLSNVRNYFNNYYNFGSAVDEWESKGIYISNNNLREDIIASLDQNKPVYVASYEKRHAFVIFGYEGIRDVDYVYLHDSSGALGLGDINVKATWSAFFQKIDNLNYLFDASILHAKNTHAPNTTVATIEVCPGWLGFERRVGMEIKSLDLEWDGSNPYPGYKYVLSDPGDTYYPANTQLGYAATTSDSLYLYPLVANNHDQTLSLVCNVDIFRNASGSWQLVDSYSSPSKDFSSHTYDSAVIPWIPLKGLGGYRDGHYYVQLSLMSGATTYDTCHFEFYLVDKADPIVNITEPAGATYTTPLSTLDIAGTATDNGTITKVEYQIDGGSWVNCTGIDTWWASGLTLTPGSNIVRVRATDTSNNTGDDVITVNFVAPGIPSLTVPPTSTTGDYMVTWSSMNGATSYELQEKVGLTGSFVTIYTGAVASYSISGKSEDVYYYHVRAINAAGNSDWSPDDLCEVVFPPVADFSGTPVIGDLPLIVSFSSSATGSITSYQWDFGDGNTSSEINPVYTYNNPGDYTVSLTVSGPGGSDMNTKTNYIHVNYPPPVANFTATPVSGVAPFTVQFSDTSQETVNSWNWDFGTGDTSTLQNPQYTYNTPGTYSVVLSVTGPGGSDVMTKTDYIFVGTAVTITSTPSLTGQIGIPYTYDADNSAMAVGTSPISWERISGPIEFSIDNSTGKITWTPLLEGNIDIAIRASNQWSSDSQFFTVQVNPELAVSTISIPDWTRSIPYSEPITQSGGTSPFTWSLDTGSLPTGITFNTSTATLEGTPTAVGGPYFFTIKVQDNIGATADAVYSIRINDVPTITTALLPDWTQGIAFSQTLGMADGTAPFLWEMESGSLPAGLSFGNDGSITGTPTETGSFNIVAKVTDFAGASDNQALTLIINPTVSVITPSIPAEWTAQLLFNESISATGGTGALTWANTGNLPPGITLNSTTGELSGTPSLAGDYAFDIVVSDTVGGSDNQNYSITINPALDIPVSSLPTTTICLPYYEIIPRVGGTGLLDFSLNAGLLPPGFSMSSDGIVSGFISGNSTGVFPFTVKLEDSLGAFIIKGLEIKLDEDLDFDLMPDSWELANGLDDPAGDLDNDGLTNLQEFLNRTDPNSNNNNMTDSDNDFIPDQYEQEKGIDDPAGDPDGDNIPNSIEYWNGTDPNIPNGDYADNNNNNIPDVWYIARGFDPTSNDVLAEDPDQDMMTNGEEYWNGTDPFNDNFTKQDTDGDKMPDFYEVAYNLDPSVDDSSDDNDGDGITNYHEYLNGTSPLFDDATEEDIDSDTMPDKWEYSNGLNVGLADDTGDADTDGMTNYTEYLIGEQPNDHVPPPQVSGLAGINGSIITLNWNESVAHDFAEYRIYRSSNSFSDISLMTSIGVVQSRSNLFFADNTGVIGEVYYYAITAMDNSLNENPTVISVGPIAPDDGIPAAVINVTAQEDVVEDAIKVTWDKYIEADFNYYNIYREESPISDVSGLTPIDSIVDPDFSEYVDTTVEDRDYYYAVTVVDVYNHENPSVFGFGPIDVISPDDITSLAADETDMQVNLSWTASVTADVVGYRVYTDDGGGYGPPLEIGTNTTAIMIGLTNEIPYTFKVTCYDENANEADGVEITATPVDNIAPVDVTNFTAEAGINEVSLSWTASISNDVEGYILYIDNGSGFDNGNDLGNVTSYMVSELISETEYSFKLTAYDEKNNESNGVLETVTTLSIPKKVPGHFGCSCSFGSERATSLEETMGFIFISLLMAISLAILKRSSRAKAFSNRAK